MATRTQKAKVGIFFTASTVLFIVCIMLIAGYTREQLVPYSVEFEESIQGLQRGGPVVYMGVPIGIVESIRVTEDFTARVKIAVNTETVTLREGVRARLGLYSLATGAMCINLTGGFPHGAILEPGSEIPADPSLIAATSSQLEEILYDITQVAADFRMAMQGVEAGELTMTIRNINSLLHSSHGVVGGMEETVQGFRMLAEDGMEEFRTLVADLGELTRETTKLVEITRGKVDGLDIVQTQAGLNRVFENLDELGASLNRAAGTFDRTADRVGRQADSLEYQMRETLNTMNATITSIRRLSDYLFDDPSALLRGRGQPQEGK